MSDLAYIVMALLIIPEILTWMALGHISRRQLKDRDDGTEKLDVKNVEGYPIGTRH